MRPSAIIFGGIGTLVETSDIQRQAFNDAFVSMGIDFQWDKSAYRNSLAGTGGQDRLSSLKFSDGSTLSKQQVIDIHSAKTSRYVERMAQANLTLRPGVATLINMARDNNIRLAWATTTSVANIEGLIRSTHGGLNHDMFAFIGNDKIVQHQKPHPQIYQIALAALSMSPSQVLAIEDSLTGVTSAKAAGIATIAFPGAFNADKDFSNADEIVHDVTEVLREHAL